MICGRPAAGQVSRQVSMQVGVGQIWLDRMHEETRLSKVVDFTRSV